MARELELKFEVDAEDAERLRRHPLLAWAEPVEQRLDSIYFDTPKRRLLRAGYSLRVRRSGRIIIQTIKAQSEAAGLLDRSEWEVRVRGMRPDLDAARETPLAGLLTERRSRKVVPVARIRVDRTIWHVDDGERSVEVAFDRGKVTASDQQQPLTELELELKWGPDAALFDVAGELARQIPLRLSVLSKADRGFALAGGPFGRAPKAPGVKLAGDMDAAAGLALIAHSCLTHFRVNEPLLVDWRPPEALHQARVAIRRLRSAFGLFRPIIARDPEKERLVADLRWIGRLLGEARNLDVFIGHLEPGAAVPRLRHARDEHYARIICALDSRRFLRAMLRLLRWLTIGEWRDRRRARARLLPFLNRRIDRLWTKVASTGDALTSLGHKRLHLLRIEIKKLRYAVEFAESLHIHDLRHRKRFAAAIEALQDQLGDINDITIARAIRRKHGLPSRDESARRAARLRAAQRSFDRLLAVGPYWREPSSTPRAAASARRQAG